MELEKDRRVLKEKKGTQHERGNALLKELLPSEQDIMKCVIQLIFTDADEALHQVHQKQSVMASSSNCQSNLSTNLMNSPLPSC